MQNTVKYFFVISHLGHSLIQRIICNITKTSFLCFLIIGIFLCCSLKCEWCSVLDVISRKESRTVDHFLCRPLHTHTSCTQCWQDSEFWIPLHTHTSCTQCWQASESHLQCKSTFHGPVLGISKFRLFQDYHHFFWVICRPMLVATDRHTCCAHQTVGESHR